MNPNDVAVSDRDRLLKAIAAASVRDDVPRLTYADWLEEHGSGDRDAATRDFIRASCNLKTCDTELVMPRAGYKWLHEHWRRLIPSVIAAHVPTRFGPGAKPMNEPLHYFRGRHLWVRAALRVEQPKPNVVKFSFELEFWKGFVVSYRGWSPRSLEALKPIVLADQPLCRFTNGPKNRMQYVPPSFRTY